MHRPSIFHTQKIKYKQLLHNVTSLIDKYWSLFVGNYEKFIKYREMFR